MLKNEVPKDYNNINYNFQASHKVTASKENKFQCTERFDLDTAGGESDFVLFSTYICYHGYLEFCNGNMTLHIK